MFVATRPQVPMSYIIDYINTYCRQFDVSNYDRRKLLLHYPLIGAAARATRADLSSLFWRSLVGPLHRYEIEHTIRGGIRAGLPVDPTGFESFAEIFFRDEYRLDDKIDTFVDLGGNTGMASLYFFANCRASRALVVEANPALIPQIRRRLASVDADVTIENAAVTAHDDPAGVRFLIADNHRQSAMTSSEAAGAVCVPAVGLAGLLERHGIERAALLKMDIEGAEFDVLRAAPEQIARFDRVFVEIHGGSDRREEFKRGLRACGFDIQDRGSSVESLTVYAIRRDNSKART